MQLHPCKLTPQRRLFGSEPFHGLCIIFSERLIDRTTGGLRPKGTRDRDLVPLLDPSFAATSSRRRFLPCRTFLPSPPPEAPSSKVQMAKRKAAAGPFSDYSALVRRLRSMDQGRRSFGEACPFGDT